MWKNCLSAILLMLLLSPLAQSCPLCDSDTARQVRAGLFDSRFVSNVGVTVLPFIVFAAIVALTYYSLPLPWLRLSALKRGAE